MGTFWALFGHSSGKLCTLKGRKYLKIECHIIYHTYKPIHSRNIGSPALKLSIGHLGLIWALLGHFWAPLGTLSVVKKNHKVIFVSILSHTSPILPKKTKNKVIFNYHTLPLSTLITVHCEQATNNSHH